MGYIETYSMLACSPERRLNKRSLFDQIVFFDNCWLEMCEFQVNSASGKYYGTEVHVTRIMAALILRKKEKCVLLFAQKPSTCSDYGRPCSTGVSVS